MVLDRQNSFTPPFAPAYMADMHVAHAPQRQRNPLQQKKHARA
jgi:hypothetical protein